jgi:hypothetical protein
MRSRRLSSHTVSSYSNPSLQQMDCADVNILLSAAGQDWCSCDSAGESFARRTGVGKGLHSIHTGAHVASKSKFATSHFEIAQSIQNRALGLPERKDDPTRLITIHEAARNLRSIYTCDATKPLNMVGTEYGIKCSMFPKDSDADFDRHTEKTVTWLPLIGDIRCVQYQQLQVPFLANSFLMEQTKGPVLHRATLMSLTRKTRSWDLVPPDVGRPVASTTLECIVSMVHRMAMVSIDFRSNKGVIRARGSGQSFSASRVRGLRLRFLENFRIRVPSPDADKVSLVCPYVHFDFFHQR